MHVADTEATLAEVQRVLKPGGIISAREFIVASSFLEPGADDTQPAWDTFANLLAANGGHPNMGRELKNAFLDAGFSDIHATASFDYFSSAPDVAFLHAFIMDWFYKPEIIGAATKFGLATQEQFDEWEQGLHEWKSHPGAVGALAFGEAIASKPLNTPGLHACIIPAVVRAAIGVGEPAAYSLTHG